MSGFDFLPFGYQSKPGNGTDLMSNLVYSLGWPGHSSIFSDMFQRNLMMGKPGYTGFPDRFQNGGGGTGGDGDGGGGGTNTPNFGKIPQWWIDWYNAKGKYGGVPPVQGLL
jgi:hypothetical protein